MTRAMEHCDDTEKEHCDDMGRELCDDSGHGVLGQKVSWNIVLTRAMEHSDDKGDGAL